MALCCKLNPTILPSLNPTKYPTFLTQMPTNLPSIHPTYLPSTFPSQVPSQLPSELPSKLPSYLPTGSPFEFPSKMPTEMPSSLPIFKQKNTKKSRNPIFSTLLILVLSLGIAVHFQFIIHFFWDSCTIYGNKKFRCICVVGNIFLDLFQKFKEKKK